MLRALMSSSPLPSSPRLSDVFARAHLVLGGQKSGKSRWAEEAAARWLAADCAHEAVLLATAWPHGPEMRERIARHQRERAGRAPGMRTQEAWRDLPAAIAGAGGERTLRVVDCLTLWLTQIMLPPPGMPALRQPPDAFLAAPGAPAWQAQAAWLLDAARACPGPLVLVSNEIGLGVIPLGRETRAFADALGWLNQQAAACCERVTFMAAGLPLHLKA